MENHIYAFAMHTMYRNFARISGAQKVPLPLPLASIAAFGKGVI